MGSEMCIRDRHRVVCVRAVCDRHARVAGGDSVFNEPLMFCLKKLSSFFAKPGLLFIASLEP